MKINANLDFSRNQSLNRVMQSLATAPASPVAGLEYYDTVLNSSYEYNGASWIPRNAANLPNGSIPLVVLATDPLARANHTGNQLAATISNLAATVQSYSLSGFAAPTDNIAMSGFTLTGLSTPTAAGHAAEYSWVLNQVQSVAAGLTVSTPAGSGLTLTGTSIVVDTAVVARKFSTTIGDGVATTFTITHNLNTLDILPVAARNIATGALELIDQVNNDINTVTITFAVPPAANTYRITVVG